MAIDPIAKATFDSLAAYMNDIGLGQLFSLSSDGTPSGWLWDQITSGVDTQDQLAVALEATPEFQTRYKVITDLRKRAAAGEPVEVPTIGQVREYEATATRILRNAGMPTWFYDHYSDAQDLMGKGISAAELEQRVGQGWSTVRDADPAVRQAFSDFYGIDQGDAALAAFVLDPTKSVAAIDKASRSAYTAGYGRSMGIDINKQYAERISSLNLNDSSVQQGLGQVAKMQGLYQTGITETPDVTAQTGIESSLFGNAEATKQLERRLLERQANERGSAGGAIVTQQGAVGLKKT